MAPRKKTPEQPICEDCWPAGWPGDDVAATCAHGTWDRYPAEQTEQAPEPAGPVE